MPRRQYQIRKVGTSGQGEPVMYGSCIVFADDESEARVLGAAMLQQVKQGTLTVQVMVSSIPTDAEMVKTRQDARDQEAMQEEAGVNLVAGYQDPQRYVT